MRSKKKPIHPEKLVKQPTFIEENKSNNKLPTIVRSITERHQPSKNTNQAPLDLTATTTRQLVRDQSFQGFNHANKKICLDPVINEIKVDGHAPLKRNRTITTRRLRLPTNLEDNMIKNEPTENEKSKGIGGAKESLSPLSSPRRKPSSRVTDLGIFSGVERKISFNNGDDNDRKYLYKELVQLNANCANALLDHKYNDNKDLLNLITDLAKLMTEVNNKSISLTKAEVEIFEVKMRYNKLNISFSPMRTISNHNL